MSAPPASELLDAVATLLRNELVPALPPDLAYRARVAAGAVELAARAMRRPQPPDDAALVDALASGSAAPDNPAVLAELRRVVRARLLIDQPGLLTRFEGS